MRRISGISSSGALGCLRARLGALRARLVPMLISLWVSIGCIASCGASGAALGDGLGPSDGSAPGELVDGSAIPVDAAMEGCPSAPSTYPGQGGSGASVGFTGGESALTVIDGAHPGPPGTRYDASLGYLRVDGDDVTLDHVYVHGGIDVYGGGSFKLTNSVVEGGWGSDTSFIVRCGRVAGATCAISSSTIRFKKGVTWTGTGTFAIYTLGDVAMTLRCNDISGSGDGIGTGSTAGTLVEYNYVHDLQTVDDNSIHQNAIFNFGAKGTVTIAHNRLVASVCPPCSTSSVFSQPGSDGNHLVIHGNYIDGGGYSLYLESGTTADVRDNVIGPDHLFGRCLFTSGVTILGFSGNVEGDADGHSLGTPLSHPGDC